MGLLSGIHPVIHFGRPSRRAGAAYLLGLDVANFHALTRYLPSSSVN